MLYGVSKNVGTMWVLEVNRTSSYAPTDEEPN